MSILDNNYARLGWQLDIADANDMWDLRDFYILIILFDVCLNYLYII